MPWNSDPLLVAGGALVGIDPITGKLMSDSGLSQTGTPIPSDDDDDVDGTGVVKLPGGKWGWKEGVDPFLGPDVPENPMGRAAGPWMPPVGSDVSMYRPDFRQIIEAASEWIPDEPVAPPAPGPDAIQTLANQARTGIQGAFTSYGADPNAYSKDIEDRIASIIAGIPAGTKDPSTFFPSDLGTDLISDLETSRRTKLANEFESNVPKTFVPLTSDDALIDAIVGEQRTSADEFIKNMLSRGQITDIGADAAKVDLDKQAERGRTKLSEIGSGLIGVEEATLGSERAKRRGNIDKLKLTDPFDVGTQKTDLSQLATDFIGTLGEGLRSGLGSTPIFDTEGLAGIARRAGGTGTSTGLSAPPREEDDDLSERTGNQILF